MLYGRHLEIWYPEVSWYTHAIGTYTVCSFWHKTNIWYLNFHPRCPISLNKISLERCPWGKHTSEWRSGRGGLLPLRTGPVCNRMKAVTVHHQYLFTCACMVDRTALSGRVSVVVVVTIPFQSVESLPNSHWTISYKLAVLRHSGSPP